VELRVKSWLPNECIANNTDTRILGVSARNLTMRAEGAGEKVFDANTGGWVD